VQADLEAEGYEVQPYVLPAAAVNAPHRRDRVWFVAFKDTNKDGWGSEQRKEESCKWEQRNSCTGNNERLRAYNDKIGSIDKSDKFNVADTPSERLEGSEWGSSEGNRFMCDGSNATDTNCEMLEHRNGCRKNGWDNKEIRVESFNGPRKWETFPTVSAICSRDDGLSDRLDSITFSKWRTESIKAGGNAIVPNVVFQIFKAIELFTIQNQ
jgi:DNA (cytosine-5)-methyltransferase 1